MDGQYFSTMTKPYHCLSFEREESKHLKYHYEFEGRNSDFNPKKLECQKGQFTM